MAETVAKLLGVPVPQAYALIKEYGGRVRKAPVEPVLRVRAKAHKLPSNTGSMGPFHRKYLERRGFDPDKLERMWGLLGTGPLSLLDKLNYSRRIIIPIFWEGEQVSFQGRDITGKAMQKYLACPEEREIIKHKHILYRSQEVSQDYSQCICVEGVADVWRIGRWAVATFGIKYTREQLRILRRFKRVVVWFDEEPQAQQQARKLRMDLSFSGVETEQIFTPKDPADTDPATVRKLVHKYLDI